MFDGTVEEDDPGFDRWHVPPDWRWSTFGEENDYIQRGKSPKYTERSDLPVVNQKCIRWTELQSEHLKYVDPAQWDKWSEERYLRPGDLMWNSTGVGTIGRAFLFTDKTKPRRAVVDSHVTILRPGPRLDPAFQYFFVRSPMVQRQIEDMQTGSTGQVELGKKVIQRTSIPVPPLADQRRIVSRIEELFSQVEAGERAIGDARRDLARYRRSVLHAAVTGALTEDWREANPAPAEDGPALLARLATERRAAWEHAELAKLAAKGKPAPKTEKQWATFRGRYKAPAIPAAEAASEQAVPESWTITQIGYLSPVSGGLTQNKSRRDLPDTRPFLRVANVYANRLDLNEVKQIGIKASELERVELRVGDLLVVEGNGSIDQIGRVARWDGSIADCVHQNHLIKIRPSSAELSDWCLRWMNSDLGRKRIEEVASSSSGLHTLSISKIEMLPVHLPPADEQAEIVSRIDEAFSRADAAEATLDAQARGARALKQSVLKAAFAGQLA